MRNRLLSTVIKVTALVLVLCAVYTLVNLQGEISRTELQAKELEREIATAKQDIQRIEDDMEALSTDEGIKKVARNKLGLADPGEIIYQDIGN